MVKGDKLYANLSGGEQTDITLTETATGRTLVAIAVGDRDSNGYALVLMRRQPYTENEEAS